MTQRSILITGCSSGIGYDAAHGLAKRGWRVFATCRAQVDCDRLISEGLEALRLDMTDPASMDEALTEILARTSGTLDALVNNAAFGLPGAVEDLPTQGLREVFETNLFGLHELTTKVIPIMRAQGYGRIVNIGSILGYVVYKWRASYTASKYALEGYTDTLRLEMADTPIKIILIDPGPITSQIRQNSVAHFERWIDWESSPRVDLYRNYLLKRLYENRGPDPYELPASAVTEKLARALDAKRPPAKVYVTTPAYAMNIARRILPTRALDWIIQKG
ncbi:MAG: NAD(P)-dependent dehydrogenase (short-subunit alcohol dehydrogenase family) [Dinoroseobacter sp.]|jgi:NAD(P)-dependent dehydrogenase (short-subunit alcohol dehydrogenase family)